MPTRVRQVLIGTALAACGILLGVGLFADKPAWLYSAATISAAVLFIQLCEVGVGVHNARVGHELKRDVRASVARADARGERFEVALSALVEHVGLAWDEKEGRYVATGSAPAAPAQLNGDMDPSEARQAREEHADRDAAAAERIRAGLIKELGEEMGQLSFNFAQQNKVAFRRACRAMSSGRLDTVRSILAPSVDRYKLNVAGEPGKGAPSSGASDAPF